MQHLINKLERNWNSEKVEALALNAIAHVEHPTFPLSWYLLAKQPDGLCTAILFHKTFPFHLDIIHIDLDDIENEFISSGNTFCIDRSFKEQNALRLWNKLKRKGSIDE